MKADNEKLKAALDGGDTREGGKEARGESMPDFLGGLQEPSPHGEHSPRGLGSYRQMLCI